MNEDANEADVHRLLGEAFTFRERPPSLSLRHPYHSTAYISGIAGDGGGTKWPQYGMGHRGQYTITRGSREIKPAGTGVPLRERHEDENLEVTSSDMCRAALLSTSMAGTAEVHQMESTLYGGGDRETSVIFTVLADYHSAYMWVQTDATGASVGIQERVFSCLVPFYDILTHYRQPPLPEGLYCLCQQSTQHHLVHALNLLLKAGTSNTNVQDCAHVCTLHRVALNGNLYDTPSADWAGAVTAAKEQYEKDKAEISRYYYI
ncbi:hypothetical protein AGDE_13401 [Angomonas deanei]|nr:hypothetical protein AGDE_13401 [Angomonas deanei]|eukprot:EPY22413.1 hypothetical protein AGDE_13401 [Angomonas deanei]